MEGMFDGLGSAVIVVCMAVFAVGFVLGVFVGKAVIPWQWIVGAVLVLALIGFGMALARWWD